MDPVDKILLSSRNCLEVFRNMTSSHYPNGTTSDGAWSGEKPIHYALPLLIIQLVLIIVFSRFFALLLRPLRQPRVIGEILGGIVLGTSVFGHVPGFSHDIFPKESRIVLTTVANLGLLYFLFMVGLELDLRSLRRTGRPAMIIAAVGITLPFALGIGTSFVVRDVLDLKSKVGPFIVFMGVAMSITAFPVLARILAERKLLTTDVGQMAMSAAAVNDVVAWILLALAIALSTPGASSAIVAWILLSGVAFLIFMFTAVQWGMGQIGKLVVDNEPIPEWIVALTFVGVLISGFCTDTIGIHGIFGAFVFGLIVPKDGPFPSLILEKLEDFTSIILLPLYFASSGLNVNFESIKGGGSVGLLFLVIGTACAGKILGTLIASLAMGIPYRKGLALGVLMNTKGLVELIVLNIGLAKQVITTEIYTIMVIMALVTTFMTTPLVMLIYEPARERVPHTKTRVEQADEELRVLAGVHGMKNLPSVLNLTEVFRGTRKRPLRVFLMHLVELSERSSAIMMVTKVRKDGRPFWSKEAEREGQDQVVVVFQAYARLSKVNVQPLTIISGFNNMHEDICAAANEKRSNIIILPYHKHIAFDGTMDMGSHGFQNVNRRVLKSAPCSVGILIDRGFGGYSQVSPSNVAKRIAVLFFGGPDDREALFLGRRMAEHPGVSLVVIHMKQAEEEAALHLSMEQAEASGQKQGTGDISASDEGSFIGGGMVRAVSFMLPLDKVSVDQETQLDNLALAPLLNTAVAAQATELENEAAATEDRELGDIAEKQEKPQQKIKLETRFVKDPVAAVMILALEEYDLIIIGRGRRCFPLVAQIAAQRTPFHHASASLGGSSRESSSELGPVGDILAHVESKSSVLVVQQHDPALAPPVKLSRTSRKHDEKQPLESEV